MITFRIDSHSGIPLYLQIKQQVKYAIQTGILIKGDRLPTIKEVISTIAINPNTVAKAYKELEKEGFVKGHAGIGTLVLGLPDERAQHVDAELGARIKAWVADAKQAGLTIETIEALLRSELYEGGDSNGARRDH